MDSRSHSTKQTVKHVWDQEAISLETQVAVHNCALRTANMAARPHENPQQRSNQFKQLCPVKKCWGIPRLFNFVALEVVLKQRRIILEPERRAETVRNRTTIYWNLRLSSNESKWVNQWTSSPLISMFFLQHYLLTRGKQAIFVVSQRAPLRFH